MRIETYYEILDYLKEIIKDTEFEGHVYSVGGCERDKHLGMKTIKDIDIVVDLPNNSGIRFAKWLESNGNTKGSVVVYENFGTAMFKLKEYSNEEIEVVHTRKEIYRDKNSRNPETDFGTIYYDCFRRDFTINALYHNISEDKDIDFSGHGLTDLEDGIIMTCNDPDVTFEDDPLRIMRAIRFASKYGFEIYSLTINGIISNVNRLKIISQERITDEFSKILMSPYPYFGIRLLESFGIMDVIMPEYKCYGKFSSILDKVKHLHKSEYYTLEAVLGLLFSQKEISPNTREIILRKFKYSNDTIKEVNLYADNAYALELACVMKFDAKIREIAKICGDREHFNRLVDVSKANNITGKKQCFNYLNEVSDIEMMFGYKLPINGNDVMEVLNIQPCKTVKSVLDKLMGIAYEWPRITREYCIDTIKVEYNV
jgi:poly(A) polymerase